MLFDLFGVLLFISKSSLNLLKYILCREIPLLLKRQIGIGDYLEISRGIGVFHAIVLNYLTKIDVMFKKTYYQH